MASRLEDAAKSPPVVKKRRRPALACAQCRRRKIRCDQNTPCHNCVRSGISDCTIPPNHISTLRRKESQATSQSATASQPAVLTPRPTPQAVYTDDASLNVEELQLKVKDLEKTIATLRQGSTDGPQSQVPHHERSTGPRFGNQSTWLNTTNLYDKVLCKLKALRNQRTELSESMKACQVLLGRVNEQLTADPNATISTFGTHMPSRAVADELLDLYLLSFEGMFRIIHVPSFCAEYEKYWEQPAQARTIFVLQLQLCLGLGSKAHPDSMRFRQTASQWFSEADTWLDATFRKSKTKQMAFEDLQLLCLTKLTEADQASSEKSTWVGAGDLVRMAMCLNLHRDPEKLGSPCLRQAELHRRLWVTILELNLLFSLQAGQKPLITPQDYDTLPPANLSDEDLDQPSVDERRYETQRITRTTAPIAFFESFHLRLETVSRANDIGSACTYDETIRWHRELTKAETKLNQKLSYQPGLSSTSHERHVDLGIQRSYMQIILSYYLLALHLPVLGHSIKDPTRHFSRKVATTVSSRMAEIWVMPEGRQGRQSSSSEQVNGSFLLNRLFTNSPGFLRNLAMQAVFYLTLEFLTMKEDQAEGIGAFSTRDEMELLRLLTPAQVWVATRVRGGMNDVNCCCFLAASISYAQDLGSPGLSSSSDEAMFKSATDRSEQCRRSLEDLAQSLGAPRHERAPVPDTGIGYNGQDAISTEISMDWMTDMILDGNGVPNYYDWSFQGNMPQVLL